MRYIKYIGLAHRRMITAQDWRSINLTGDTVIWEPENGFAVPLDALNEDQIRKAIEIDRDFVITGDDEEFTPQPVRGNFTPEQASQAIENPVDVLAMANGDDNASTDDSGAAGAPGGAAPTSVTTGTGSGHDE